MARRPLGKTDADIVDHWRIDACRGAVHPEMLVVAPIFASTLAFAEQAQMPDRIHAAVTDGLAHEMHQPWQIIAVDRGGEGSAQRVDTGGKLARQTLIGIEMQLPIVFQRQIVHGPVALPAIILEGVIDDLGAVPFGDRQGRIRAAGIDHMDVVGDEGGAGQRGAQARLGIEGQNDNGKSHEATGGKRRIDGRGMVAEAGAQV